MQMQAEKVIIFMTINFVFASKIFYQYLEIAQKIFRMQLQKYSLKKTMPN